MHLLGFKNIDIFIIIQSIFVKPNQCKSYGIAFHRDNVIETSIFCYLIKIIEAWWCIIQITILTFSKLYRIYSKTFSNMLMT